LDKAQVSPDRIVIEITEKLVIENYNLFREAMAYFTDLGMSFAVDDVGSGYSGLESIARLKPTFLKIDISLIRDVHVSHVNQAMDARGTTGRSLRGGPRGPARVPARLSCGCRSPRGPRRRPLVGLRGAAPVRPVAFAPGRDAEPGLAGHDVARRCPELLLPAARGPRPALGSPCGRAPAPARGRSGSSAGARRRR